MFEVKGFKNEWNGSFIMSKNEINRANDSLNNSFEAYFVAIVDFVGSGEIRLAAFFDWSEHGKFMKFSSETTKLEWDQKSFDENLIAQQMMAERQKEEYNYANFQNQFIANQGNQQNFQEKYCFYKYRCKKGVYCLFSHSQGEVNFFRYHKIDGSKFIDFGKVKVTGCRFPNGHQDQFERDICLFAHDEYDSFCLNCNGWAGHLRENCPFRT